MPNTSIKWLFEILKYTIPIDNQILIVEEFETNLYSKTKKYSIINLWK